jgi:hypothetical protein
VTVGSCGDLREIPSAVRSIRSSEEVTPTQEFKPRGVIGIKSQSAIRSQESCAGLSPRSQRRSPGGVIGILESSGFC